MAPCRPCAACAITNICIVLYLLILYLLHVYPLDTLSVLYVPLFQSLHCTMFLLVKLSPTTNVHVSLSHCHSTVAVLIVLKQY